MPPIALQLWSVRDDQAKDFAATAAAVARMGYAAVETAGYGSAGKADEAARILRDNGLSVASMHVGFHAIRNETSKVVSEAILLGAHHVVVPGYDMRLLSTADACLRFGEELDVLGAQLRTHGLHLSFHNHAHELHKRGEHTVLDLILAASQPRNLSSQLDVYWCHVGGVAPADFLRRHGNRVRLLHLKDGDGTTQKVLGQGVVDFPALFATADAIGAIEGAIVEQEQYDTTPLDCVARCRAQLKAWGRG